MTKFDEWWETSGAKKLGDDIEEDFMFIAREAFEAATLIERERCCNVAKNLVYGPGLDLIGQAYAEAINEVE